VDRREEYAIRRKAAEEIHAEMKSRRRRQEARRALLLMDSLDKWELTGNTILIFMSDNGKTWAGGNNTVHGETYNAGMHGFKGSVYEGGTRVPFFIRWPGKFDEGVDIDTMLNHYDILPTLADIAGIDISDIQGIDGQNAQLFCLILLKYFIDSFAGSFRGDPHIVTTDIGKVDAILGGEAKLKEAIIEIDRRY